ncbi:MULTISPECIES: hypothetical protein [Bacillus cereus group]|uniref:hypothetical protein n=1 Tax=Bacillus cereus group TaxID=86661 RepID=UPI000B43A8A0|nr:MULTISPECIES: hypothetical protein [Bacillus cereus group]OUB84203.1 hypothetical protein BK788_15155 [Bacillus thuringiensis serovar sinensis]HDW3054771.1 hypothetical protein [Bacillus cereus]HDX9526446.1 hypothetical protein [Bacillus thuringiensis]MCU5114932.1 hypothetical protein [Bacillus wiedmannii]MCU5150324.1 hypothetical protein [Bacillus wiedmannii]
MNLHKDRKLNATDIKKYFSFLYNDKQIRVVLTTSNQYLFVGYDIGKNVIGIKNPYSLIENMDNRSKCSAVITFNQDINPQRYILVDLEGLHHMVYRARKVKVNRLDFIYWAISLEKNIL